MADPQAEARGPTGAPPPQADFQVTAGAHLEDGVLHISDLYAGAVVGWFKRRESFEPGARTHKKGDVKDSQRHPQLARLSSLMIETCNISPSTGNTMTYL